MRAIKLNDKISEINKDNTNKNIVKFNLMDFQDNEIKKRKQIKYWKKIH